MKTILSFQDVQYNYHSMNGETPALKDVNFDVYDGEFLSIVGPSGCGKTTLLSMAAGLLKPQSGKVQLSADLAENKHSIGYMLQHDHLFEWRTIYKNILLGLEIQHDRSSNSLEKIDTLLKKYGLYRFRNKYPSELSGGMRQRAALIRTLVLDPKLLLLDEPFSALDYQTRLSVSGDIVDIIKREQKTAILVTHDLSEAISLSDRIIVLTNRPGHVLKSLPVHLTKQGNSAVAARKSPEFSAYFNELWEDLHGNESEEI